jgi:hypothetical protein
MYTILTGLQRPNSKALLSISALFLFTTGLSAQNTDFEPYEIQKVTEADFSVPDSLYEEEDGAIYLYRLGQAKLEYGVRNVSCVYTVRERLLILNNTGQELADKKIWLVVGDKDAQTLSQVKGTVYNLVDGNIEKEKLKNSDWQIEKYNDFRNVAQLTFKNVKVGSIVELEYNFHDPFWFKMDDWNLQCDYPVIYSEFQVSYPANFGYKILKLGNHPLSNSKNWQKRIVNGVGVAANYDYDEVNYLFSAENIPALRPEPVMDSPENYRATILTELHYIDPIGVGERQFFYNNWMEAVDEYYEEGTNQRFLDTDQLDGAFSIDESSAYTQLDLISEIYNQVRQRLGSNGRGGSIVMDQRPKDILRSNTATDCEINMILMSALRSNGIEAFPFLYSQRKYKTVLSGFPLITQFNSLLVIAYVDDGYVLLDASDPTLTPGEIQEDAYNGEGLAAEPKKPRWYPLKSIAPTHQRCSIELTELGENSVIGTMKIRLTGIYAERLRDYSLVHSAEELNDYFTLTDGATAKLTESNLDKKRTEVELTFEIEVPLEKYEDSYIFPAVIVEQISDNPFDKKDRKYPVVFPDQWQEDYTCLLRLDADKYHIEVPKSRNLILPEKDAELMFTSSYNFGSLVVRSSVKMNQNRLDQQKYPSLRTFYDEVAAAQSSFIEIQTK